MPFIPTKMHKNKAAYRDVTASVVEGGVLKLEIIILNSPWVGAGFYAKRAKSPISFTHSANSRTLYISSTKVR